MLAHKIAQTNRHSDCLPTQAETSFVEKEFGTIVITHFDLADNANKKTGPLTTVPLSATDSTNISFHDLRLNRLIPRVPGRNRVRPGDTLWDENHFSSRAF